MISMTSVAPAPLTAAPLPSPPESAPERPGKSGNAVGQVAKQAVSQARAAGVELPANAQGLAASQIAKGADPASLFALQAPVGPAIADDLQVPVEGNSDAPVEDVADTPLTGGTSASGDDVALELITQAAEEAAETAAVAQEAYASAAVATSGDSSAQIALDLLS